MLIYALAILQQRAFNFSIGDKGIKELKDEFLIFLGVAADILDAVKGGRIKFRIGIATSRDTSRILAILVASSVNDFISSRS